MELGQPVDRELGVLDRVQSPGEEDERPLIGRVEAKLATQPLAEETTLVGR